jgi:hypothetical protein
LAYEEVTWNEENCTMISFVNCTKYYYDDQIKENEMGSACR